VKFVKLLTVPAVVLITLLIAAPAFAHTLSGGTLSQACDKTTGKICLTLAGTIEAGNDARTVEFDLFGVDSKGTVSQSLDKVLFPIPANKTDEPVAFPADMRCFKAITTGGFASFVVKIMGVTDAQGSTSDLDLKLTISNPDGTKKTESIQFNPGEQEAVTVLAGIQPCVEAQTPPPPPQQSASPTAVATTTLAQTGGFDFRFPLIGLVLLVAGGALYVVSASRGRSAGTK
jgi:hypothetical protein